MDDPKFNPETGLYERVGEGSRRGGQEVERKRDKGQERERGEQERNREPWIGAWKGQIWP